MAREGLHQHRKFLRLVEVIGCMALARGILEMLWEPAYASGDDLLGDAVDIWIRCGKPPNLDAQSLSSALQQCGFIDVDEDGNGYRIHDLFDHMPRNVVRRAQREAVRLNLGVSISQLRSEAGRKGMKSRWGDNKRITSDNKRITNDVTQHTAHSTQLETFAGSAQSTTPQPAQGPGSVMDRRSRPRKEPNPRHTPLKAELFSAFREVTGTDYGFQGARDAGGIATLLKLCPDDEEIITRWRIAWGRTGFQRPKDIPDFASKWNLYALPQANAPPRDIRKGVVRAEDMDHSTNVEDERGNIRL